MVNHSAIKMLNVHCVSRRKDHQKGNHIKLEPCHYLLNMIIRCLVFVLHLFKYVIAIRHINKNWANIIYYLKYLIRNVSNVVLMESNAVVFIYFEICTTHHERE